MPDRMGPMQARAIASKIEHLCDEVTHWQAAHPDADDQQVGWLEFHLRHALGVARHIDESRSVWPNKEK